MAISASPPPLLVLPLDLLFPSLAGRWSRALLLSLSSLGVLYAYRILVLAAPPREGEPCGLGRKLLFSLFVLAVGIGSSNLFMASRSHMFHEAVVWGSASRWRAAITCFDTSGRPRRVS